MDRTQISIFKQTYHVGFAGFLDGKDGLRLEPKIALVLRRDFSNKALEGKLADEEFGRLLELSDLTECHSAWSESVRLLDTFVSHIGCLAG